eukprot:m.293317 g.293317  ORF g.293317 m.293317 type:complete len:1163 (-) comp20333_c0_seq1:66-3554(-)
MSIHPRLTHANWEVNYNKIKSAELKTLKSKFEQLKVFVDANQFPQALKDLGEKAQAAYNLKSVVTAAVVGGPRAGKSLLNGHLMYDQDAVLKSPLRVDDGQRHVTTMLTLTRHSDAFSVCLKPLPVATRADVVKHADKFNDNLDEAASRIRLPPSVEDVCDETLDFAEALKTSARFIQDSLDVSSLARFATCGPDTSSWSKQDQYAFIKACADLVADSQSFCPFARFFYLEVSAPWLPKDVALWDTPGMGDGRFDPLIKHALMQAEVIIPYQRGNTVISAIISKCFKLLAEADAKHLQAHPRLLLLFEKPGKSELEAYCRSWADEPPSDEQLAQKYCDDVRRSYYCSEVLVSAESDCFKDVPGASDLFNEVRNTLMVRADTYKADYGDFSHIAVLKDPKLHQELLYRSNFRSVNVWVHACACFFFQARMLARPANKSSAVKPKPFSIKKADLRISANALCDVLEEMLTQSWENYVEDEPSLSEEDLRDRPALPSFFNQWVTENRLQVQSLMRIAWTDMFGSALNSYRETAMAQLLERGLPQGVVEGLFEGAYTQISTASFAIEPRAQADEAAAQENDAVFTECSEMLLSDDDADDDDNDDNTGLLIAPVIWLLKERVHCVFKRWAACLQRIAKDVNDVLKDSYRTLHDAPKDEHARQTLQAICRDGARLVNNVIKKPDAKPPTKTLLLPLPKFSPNPFETPEVRVKLARKCNRSLDVAYDLDVPFTAHLRMPRQNENGTINVDMHAHPAIQDIVSRYKTDSQKERASLAVPPVIILGCPGFDLVDNIAKTGHPLENEERYHQRELKPMTVLRILLVDEPTSKKASDYTNNLSDTLLLFKVMTGTGYLSAAQLLDYSHLIGSWLAQDEPWGSTTLEGPKLFIRMESGAKVFNEASTFGHLAPTSPARVFKGLEQALLDGTTHLQEIEAAAILKKWDVSDISELYPDLDNSSALQVMMFSNKVSKGDNPAKDLKAALADPKLKLPDAIRQEVEDSLRVQVLSASSLTEGAARKRWLAQWASTVQKNQEQNRRCNYRVRYYKSLCRTFEQTQCVLVNSVVAEGVWACPDGVFTADPLGKPEESSFKALRNAEGLFVRNALKGVRTTSPKAVSTGLACLVVDQFSINSDCRSKRAQTSSPNKNATSKWNNSKRPNGGQGSAKKSKE